MAGIFSEAQPRYAALGIATFPFDATEEVKRGPLVKHYGRMGLRASRQIALRFPEAPGIAAMAGKRNRFTIVDIDERGPAGERLLADVQSQFGKSKVVVRTGSGGFHCYYLYNGEARKIRPDPGKPIDLIGDGPIVLPPSRGIGGNYEIIQGHLEDLTALERIRTKTLIVADSRFDPRSILIGERDQKFWPYIKRYAHQAQNYQELLSHARDINELILNPLTDAEVVAKCNYWWRKTELGENKWGVGRFTTIDFKLIDDLMMRDPDAFTLLIFLRRHHWGREFYLANETCTRMPGGGWCRKRFAGARSRLIEGGYLTVIREATVQPPRPILLRLAKIDHQ
jgi:hypothetical protein